MPHPERHVSCIQHPLRTRQRADQEGDGLAIFKNAVNYFK
jgi:phosphoribosylformylglycinamidine synthase